MDGVAFGDPMTVPPELIAYMEERLKGAHRPHLKARYADFLWQKTGDHKAARQAVLSHIELVKFEASREKYHDAADSARRALRLCYALGDESLRQETEDALSGACAEWSENEDAALFLPEVAECIADNRQSSESRLKAWVEILKIALSNAQDHRVRRDLLGALARVLDRLARPDDAIALRAEIGDEWVAEAEERVDDSALVAAAFYQHAFDAYAAAGELEKAEVVKRLVRTTYLAAESEFGEISHQAPLDMKPWQKEVAGWTSMSPVEALSKLGASFWLMPDWGKAEESSDHTARTAPLSQLIPRTTLDDGRPVSQPRNPEQQREDNVRNNYQMEMALRTVFLSAALNELRERMTLTADEFISTLLQSPFFTDRDLAIEGVGFTRLIEGDFVSALHILVPRIEEAIRRQAAALGCDTTAIRNGIMTEKSLDRLLDDDDVEALLRLVPQLYDYVRELLIEHVGPNLRNKIAHGMITHAECGQDNADRVVLVFLVMSLYRARDSDDAINQSGPN